VGFNELESGAAGFGKTRPVARSPLYPITPLRLTRSTGHRNRTRREGRSELPRSSPARVSPRSRLLPQTGGERHYRHEITQLGCLARLFGVAHRQIGSGAPPDGPDDIRSFLPSMAADACCSLHRGGGYLDVNPKNPSAPSPRLHR
jgi:hypothetical protein